MIETNFTDYINKLKELENILATEIAQEAVNQFQENFRRQGFFAPNTWTKRFGNIDPERGILIGKGSGAKLWRSLRYEVKGNNIIIIADRPYAEKHNAGFRGTENVKPSTIESHKRKQQNKIVTVKRHQRKAFQRQVNVPKRQFLGNHPVFERNMIDFINKLIKSTLK